jgi:low affinity Fe/Cu permease
METRSVYIVIGNHGKRLYVDAAINSWQDKEIVAHSDVEHVELIGVEQPDESEYRQWVAMVARMGARAIEDALMMRVYKGTANEPLKFEIKKNSPAKGAVQDR